MDVHQHYHNTQKRLQEIAKHQQLKQARVVKVESEKTWDLIVSQAIDSKSPIVVLFMASWCIPSVAMKQPFEEPALSYQDISFLLVDVDEVKKVASRMEIKAMPTFVLMKEGVLVDKVVGANPDEIKKRVELLVVN